MLSIKAVYEVEADNLQEAAHAIAFGQSIGNPEVRTALDTPELIETHVPRYEISGNKIQLDFPIKNFNEEDGINYLLSVLMGGQTDIQSIQSCKLVDLDLNLFSKHLFPRPRYGVTGIRKLLNVYSRPLLCGIVKPKIGLSPFKHAQICEEMALGGCDFIKEDEILNNQAFCPFKERLEAVRSALIGSNILYIPCITGDGLRILKHAQIAEDLGFRFAHVNIWAGLGAYRELRLHSDLGIFFQKSGERVWTTGPYSIDFKVLLKLAHLVGCDIAHVGMKGGYLNEETEELCERIKVLGSTMPSFSCGMKPELVPGLVREFGNDIIITSGGYLCGHPEGPRKGAAAFKEAIHQEV